MKCYVCDKESWHRPTIKKGDDILPIHSKGTIQICKECGSCCFNVEPDQEDKIKEYYRKEYRPAPTIVNLITTTHKQNYTSVFLRDFLAERKGRQLLIGDVGAATGYLCNFFRMLGHKATGSEYTVTYRRMSEHYYGIPLTEELEPKHKYDLIVLYHVFEHLIEPDKKLEKYVGMLVDGGHVLISTPRWFDELEQASGEDILGFEHHFHKDHINVFSRTSLTNLFSKAGLSIVKEDQFQYGQTYLLSKESTTRPSDWMHKEDWTEVEKKLLVGHKAIQLYLEGKYREAYELCPRFPEAWIKMIFLKATKDLSKQADLFAEAEKVLPMSSRLRLVKGQWFYQQGRLTEALKIFEELVALKPNEDIFMNIGFCYGQLGKSVEAIKNYQIACVMDPRKWTEAQNLILKEAASLPTWDERALAQAKELLFEKARKDGVMEPKLVDKVMENATKS